MWYRAGRERPWNCRSAPSGSRMPGWCEVRGGASLGFRLRAFHCVCRRPAGRGYLCFCKIHSDPSEGEVAFEHVDSSAVDVVGGEKEAGSEAVFVNMVRAV